jgi:Ca2+-binding RTX toxin-like protein
MHLVRIAALALASVALPAMTAHAHAAAPVRCHGRVATIVGTAGADHLVGTAGDDVIAALGGDDRVDGLGGHDDICGGSGNDDLLGGDANDVLRGQQGDDRLVSGAGRRAYLDGGPGNDRLISAATRLDRLSGGSGDDTLRTSSPHLILVPEAGDDTITTTRPAVVGLEALESPVGIRLDAPRGLLIGTGRTDLRFAPGTTVSVVGSSHDDVLVGTPGADDLAGNGGDDVVRGAGGPDQLSGGTGTNVLRGGAGADAISRDDQFGRTGRQLTQGGSGHDLIFFRGRDRVHGGAGGDSLEGTLVPGPGQLVDGGPGANALHVNVSAPSAGSTWAHVLIDLGRELADADGRSIRLRGLFTTLELLSDGRPVAAAWTLRGTERSDLISLREGTANVTIDGRGGDDSLTSGSGEDTIDGGTGSDTADAGAGTDTCTSVETPTSCETLIP